MIDTEQLKITHLSDDGCTTDVTFLPGLRQISDCTLNSLTPLTLTKNDPRWRRAKSYVLKPGESSELRAEEKRGIYVSIDTETTGLSSEHCQILEFGAAIEDWVTPVPELQKFHCYLIQDQIHGEPYALSMHAEILRRIAQRDKEENHKYLFLRPRMLHHTFHRWLKAHGAFHEGEKITVAGKNFAFDRGFLGQIGNFEIKMQHRVIDPAMLYWNPKTDPTPPDTKTCKERAGILGEVRHTALEDALDIILMVRARFPNYTLPPRRSTRD